MSRVTAKYQITIPPEIRRTLGIFPGMEVSFIRKGDAFELTVDPVNVPSPPGHRESLAHLSIG